MLDWLIEGSGALREVSVTYPLGAMKRIVVRGIQDSPKFVAVEADDGRRYLVKCAPFYVQNEDYAITTRLHRQLFKRGAPVPELMMTASDRTFARIGAAVIGVQRLVEATNCRIPEVEAHGFGVALARLHDTGVSMTDEWPAGDWSFPVGRHRWLPDSPACLAAASAYWRTVPGINPRTADRLQDTAQALLTQCLLSDLSQSFIHGDASASHCLSTSDGPVLIDLDELRWGYCLFDLSQALSTVGAFDRHDLHMHLRERWNAPAMVALLSGYESVRALRPSERRGLGPWLGLTAIRVAAGELHIDDPAETPDPVAAVAAEYLVDLLGALDSPQSPLPDWAPRHRVS